MIKKSKQVIVLGRRLHSQSSLSGGRLFDAEARTCGAWIFISENESGILVAHGRETISEERRCRRPKRPTQRLTLNGHSVSHWKTGEQRWEGWRCTLLPTFQHWPFPTSVTNSVAGSVHNDFELNAKREKNFRQNGRKMHETTGQHASRIPNHVSVSLLSIMKERTSICGLSYCDECHSTV